MSSVIETNTPNKELDAGMMIRRALFLLVLVLLTLYYLSLDFKGLSSPTGMEQAQISREIARGNNYQTKCIRPVALAQVNQHLKDTNRGAEGISLMKMPETYQAPLNPLLNSMVLSINKDLFKFDPKGVIYTPDILIAGVAMVLLLSSIGINYLLVSRIFDPRIGGVTACLMLLSELMWRYSQSGLPQMLMLFLFSFGTYFLYKAVENQHQAKSTYLWVALAGGFFALLGLSHWLTVWMFLGLLMFSAFYFQPRGIQMVVLLTVYGVVASIFAIHNIESTGNVMGSGVYAFYSRSEADGLERIMRDYTAQSGVLSFDGFITKTATNMVSQLNDLYAYMGSIVVAPLFFLSLLHKFRRNEIADFRWALLTMWLFATIGMSIFGISPFALEKIHTNNLHILFAPLFTAYGLAFVSVLWNRLNLPMHEPIVRNGHFVLAIVISAFPFIVNMPMNISNSSKIPPEFKRHYPMYYPRAISAIGSCMSDKEVLVSDTPWATAWYGDRVSIWLPKTMKQFYELQTYCQKKNEDIVGIYLSPASLEKTMYTGVIEGIGAGDWMPMMLRWPIANKMDGLDIMEKNTEFPFKMPIWLGNGTMFYTDQGRAQLFVEDLKKSQNRE